MLKKYLTKFTIDILPSVAATVIGAYIVNHYIVTKPGADAPAAAAVSAADPKAADPKAADPKAADPKVAAKSTEAKTTETKAKEAGNLPAAGVKARGISEKAIFEKTAAERPAVVEKVDAKADLKADLKADVKANPKAAEVKASESKASESKSSESKAEAKPADAPVETASIPAEPRPQRAAPREKIRVVLPSPVQAVTPPVAAAPPSAPVVAPVVETASVPDERRDANDLARAAIERLRVNNDGSPHVPEVARTHEYPRIETPRIATAPALRPLPPPITVATPSGGETFDQGRPPYAANASADPRRPTPPAEIPLSRPLDLRADMAEPSVRERPSVAEDVLSAAKSVFHAVLPK
jgi:hypothetical protein